MSRGQSGLPNYAFRWPELDGQISGVGHAASIRASELGPIRAIEQARCQSCENEKGPVRHWIEYTDNEYRPLDWYPSLPDMGRERLVVGWGDTIEPGPAQLMSSLP